MDQLGLTLNEAEAYAYGTKSATAEQIAVKAHARKRQFGNILEVVPEGLFRLAPCGRLPGIPQAAGEHPGGWVLGTRTAQI